MNNVGKTVAWGDADTCRKCHDAGTSDAGAGKVVYSSWPHVTPGYYRFMSAASDAASYAANNAPTGAAGRKNGMTMGANEVLGGTTAANFLAEGAFVNLATR